MDDALLDDDGQFKDDEVEDEIDEAALLGLSDDELDDLEDNQGSDIRGKKETKSKSGRESSVQYLGGNEEDVLEVNADADLDNFIPSDLDNSYTEEVSRQTSIKNVRYKENLIPITLIPSISTSRSPGAVKSEREYEDNKAAHDSVLLDDEESEDEGFDDERRERFKSERSNIITLTPAKKRSDIPDSLDSVLDSGEKYKAQAFLESERRKKNFIRNRNVGGGNFRDRTARTNVPSQARFTNQNSGPRKIHINPHFNRGISTPSALVPPTSHAQPMVSSSYSHNQQSNFLPPTAAVAPQTQYRHDVFTSQPPPAAHQPNFPPIESFPVSPLQPTVSNFVPSQNFHQYGGQQPNMGNMMSPPSVNQPVPTWNQPPPNLVPVQHPPPQVAPPVSSHYAYTNIAPAAPSYPPPFPPPNYQAGNFPPPGPSPVPKTEPVVQNNQWNQPYSAVPFSKSSSVFQARVQLQAKSGGMKVSSQFQSQQIQRMGQNHARKLVKRPASFPVKTEPVKQLRLADSQRKTNFIIRKTNTNIKEIKLIDNLPVQPKRTQQNEIFTQLEEDEETKQLRLRIEEQKEIREMIVKRKEERRRQMAAQRLLDIRQQQVVQVPPRVNVKARVGISPVTTVTNSTIKNFTAKVMIQTKMPQMRQKPITNQATPRTNVSVHQRIGLKNNMAKIALLNQVQQKQSAAIAKKLVLPQNKKPGLIAKMNPKRNNLITTSKKILLKSKKMFNVPGTLGNRTRFPPPAMLNRNLRPPNMNLFRGLSATSNRNATPAWMPTTAPINARFPRPPFEINRLNIPFPPNQKPSVPLSFQLPTPRFPLEQQPQNFFGADPMNCPRPGMENPRHLLNAPQPSMNERRPLMDGPRPLMERPRPFMDGPQPFMDRPRPFMDRPRPFMDGPRPFMDGPRPFMDGPRPFMNRPRAFADGPQPFMEGHRSFFSGPRPFLDPARPFADGPRHFMDGPQPGNHIFPPFQQTPLRFPLHTEKHFRNMPPEPSRQRMPLHRFSSPSREKRQLHVKQEAHSPQKKQVQIKQEPSSPQKNQVQVKQEILSPKKALVATASELIPKKEEIKESHSFPVVPTIKTRFVSVTNLSSSTSEAQLKNLSSGVGPIENIVLDKGNRKAKITFKQEQHAAKFQQKYQRYMLDLALIEVSLEPI